MNTESSPIFRSLVIETLKSKTSTSVVYAYCRFNEQCKAESILRGFIHQFLAQHSKLLPVVNKHYKKHRLQRTGPSVKEVIEMLHSLVVSLDNPHIVVDGLDEIASDKERAALLQELHKLPARILIFSRSLELHFKHLPGATIFSIKAQDQDIESFIVSSLLNHASFQVTIVGAEDGLVRDVATRIKERCHGM
jgi:hypothetical protein